MQRDDRCKLADQGSAVLRLRAGVGHKLLKHPKVQAALSEVMCHLGMTPEWIKSLIMEIAAGADMADFEPYLKGEKTLEELRRDGVNTRLVRKARRTAEKDGSEHFNLVLADPMPALKELVRILGLITEKHEHTIKGGLGLEKMSDDELRRLAHAMRPDVECTVRDG